MPPLPFLLTPLIIAGLIGASILAGVIRARTARRLGSVDKMSDADMCWICRSTDMQTLGPGAYRCRACEGLQGPNAKTYRDAARRAGLAKMSPSERRALAARLLGEAKLEEIAASGELEHVASLSEADISGGEERDKMSRFANVLLRVGTFEQKLVDAALALASPEQVQRLAVDIGSIRAVIDEMDITVWWSFDSGRGFANVSARAELRTHRDIERAMAHVAELARLRSRLEAKLAISR